MISSAFSASKRGSMVTVAPLETAPFIVQVWPNEWNSGSAPSRTSPSPNSAKPATTRQLRRRFACVSSAPLGLPVVPLV